MDFSLSEEQEEIRGLAERIFREQATVDRVKAFERSDERFDRDLWAELARAGLVGLVVPEEHGGNGFGLIELCLLLEQQARVVAPLPLLWTLTAAMAVAEFGTAEQRSAWLPGVATGDVVLTSALEPTAEDVRPNAENQLTGHRVSVPAAHLAARVLVPADDGRLYLVDPNGPGVARQVAETTDRQLQSHLTLDRAPGEQLGDERATEWLHERTTVGLCALQVGVAEAALRLAADYTSNRHQFGKPLSTFQGVALKAADAYIDTEAMRATMWQAAWRLSEGLDAGRAVLVAKWWAADAGQRVVHATQHLHGGMGADVDYPVHRYFLWGKQLADTLGAASPTLARLGRALAEATA